MTKELYSVNGTFDRYKKLYGQEPQLPHPNLKAPEFDYVPSVEQNKYENMFTAVGTLASVGAILAIK